MNLEKTSGLPLKLVGDKIYLDGVMLKPDVRTIADMKAVFLKKTAKKGISYFMYRDACRPSDKSIFAKNHLRYDLTVVSAFTIGGEYNKTFGHYHGVHEKVTYPEIYEVLAGRAHFIIQGKLIRDSVSDVAVVEAREGEAVIVPPDYAHAMINTTKSTLVLANLVSDKFKNDYIDFTRLHGAAYYQTRKGFVKNKHYSSVPKIRRLKESGVKKKLLGSSGPMYKTFVSNPKRFAFLNEPEKYEKKMLAVIS